MDAYLVNIRKTRERLISICGKLGIFLFICFTIYCLSVASILALTLVPPPGFSRLGPLDPFALVPFICSNGAVGFAIFLLAVMFKGIGKDASPFSRRRVQQIQLLGILFLLVVATSAFVTPGIEIGVTDGVSAFSFYGNHAAADSINFDISSLIAAIVCFALSLIFKYGALLQQETDDLM